MIKLCDTTTGCSYTVRAIIQTCQQPVVFHNMIIRPAGVAQSVERVALISPDIPTSRSRVRAPPSAIPTPLLSFFLAVCSDARKLIFGAFQIW
jgi:hypothetical protein